MKHKIDRTPKPHCTECGHLLPDHAGRCPRMHERDEHTLESALLTAEQYTEENPEGALRLTEWAMRREGIPVLR